MTDNKRYTKEVLLSGLFITLLVWMNYTIANSSLDTHCNPGIAFGIILPQAAFVVLWGAVMLLIAILIINGAHTDSTMKRIGLYLILSGGIANMADRLLHGCVIDYISLVSWNTFNVADAAIFCGAAFLIFFSTKRMVEVDSNSNAEDN
jgi:signal peptidase II